MPLITSVPATSHAVPSETHFSPGCAVPEILQPSADPSVTALVVQTRTRTTPMRLIIEVQIGDQPSFEKVPRDGWPRVPLAQWRLADTRPPLNRSVVDPAVIPLCCLRY